MRKNIDEYFVQLRSEEGVRLKNERVRLGFNQGEFAKLLGVHRNTQRSYENGERAPDDNYYMAAANLGLSLPYVLNDINLDDLPNLTRKIAKLVFTDSSISLNADAMSNLFWMLGINELNQNANSPYELSSVVVGSLVKLAIERGDVFNEAYLAIYSYANSLIINDSNDDLNQPLAASMIIETINLYDKIKGNLEGLKLHDNVRLVAEAIVRKHGGLTVK